MKKKIDSTPIVVDPFNTDFAHRWSWTTLGKALLNAAENHAKSRGFGMMDLNGRHYTWVLARLSIEMMKMPRVYDTLHVNTWIENIYSLFTNRNFSLIGTDGQVYGYARSIWSMIDFDTRQPAQLEQLEGYLFEPYLCPEEPCPIDKVARVRPLSNDCFVKTIDTQYSDIDMNGHVNSIKYVEHVMDLFPMEAYQEGRNLQRIDLAYMAESYIGDQLSLFCREIDSDTFEVEIRKDYHGDELKGKVCVRCLMKFG
jgi:acyl-ACP thioesterase